MSYREEMGEYKTRSNIWRNNSDGFSKTAERHELWHLKSTINPRLDTSK